MTDEATAEAILREDGPADDSKTPGRRASEPTEGVDVNPPGRVAIVTGGGTGIGGAIARRLAGHGTGVAVIGRRPGPLDETTAACLAIGGQGFSIPADLEDPAVPARVVETVLERWGRIDVIVNDAAVIKNLPLAEMPLEVFDQHLAVNIRAPFLLVKAALPAYGRRAARLSSTSRPRPPAWPSRVRPSTA